MIIALVAVFYLFMIRPENKRKKQQDEMRSNLRKGDQITTIGGVVGRIVQVQDDTLIIETSEDRVRMEFAKWAVSTVGVQKKMEDTNNNKRNRQNQTPEERAAALAPTEGESAAAEEEK
jgi:preprotein translocase subunit YajC